MPVRPVLFLALVVSPLALAQQIATSDPLERTGAYTLELGADGRPGPDYFYMGFVHGLPRQAVQLGFNGRQSSSRGGGVYRGGEFSSPMVYRDPYGLRYYSLGWAGDSLGQAIGGVKERAAKKLSLNADEKRLAAVPDAIKADGTPYANRARLNLFDPFTRELLLRYARAHVAAWSAETENRATGSSVQYWGLDNEWEGSLDYSPEARAAFAVWLRQAYKNDLGGLNEAWTTGAADHDASAARTYASFEAAARGPLPAAADYAARPGAFLDWITFQSEHFTGFLAELGRAMHEADPLKRGVVHKSTQQTIEMPVVNRAHAFNHELFGELMRDVGDNLLATDMYGSGDRQSYELSYLYNIVRPRDRASSRFGVFLPETNNHNGPGHAYAATTWRMLGNGLKAVDFFTLGFAGAKDDWDKFGFHDPATGAPKDKLFYAARWAHMVHRSEAFWKNSAPAAGLPRVAMLLPRRDVLLSEKSGRSTSRWGYARNHRWLVYRWLREQGYWVDVIPSTKLDAGYLADYQALVLVGAEHLSDAETDAITGYVQAGGALVADARAAYYDEHHRARPARLASVLGLQPLAAVASPVAGETKTIIDTLHSEQLLLADQRIAVKAGTARVVTHDKSSRPVVWLNTANTGRGRALYLGFELGTAVLKKPAEAMAAFLLDGPTADIEEYARQEGELAIGRWLGDLLKTAGLAPGCTSDDLLAETGNLRVEQPFADPAGNLAVVVGTRADTVQSPLPAGAITLPLPGGPWSRALWAPAEDDGLRELPVSVVDQAAGLCRIGLPEVSSAGVLYLFRNYSAPVLGLARVGSAVRSADGHGARVTPGRPFAVTVELVNTTGGTLPVGVLSPRVLAGWTVSAGELVAPALAAGERHEATFTVTPPSDPVLIAPDWLYPVVVSWSEGRDGARRAVITANVELDVPEDARLFLLTDNAGYPETYPRRLKTGATYAYARAAGDAATISDPARPAKGVAVGTGLTNGFNSRIGLRSSGGEHNAYATVYAAKDVAVVFDLKAPRSIRRVVVNAGPGDLMPKRLLVSTSVDERVWNDPVVQSVPTGQAAVREYTVILPALDGKARYVRVAVEWPVAGGTLDEIEIWGR